MAAAGGKDAELAQAGARELRAASGKGVLCRDWKAVVQSLCGPSMRLERSGLTLCGEGEAPFAIEYF